MTEKRKRRTIKEILDNSKLALSIIKIFIGLVMGIIGMTPVLYITVNKAVAKANERNDGIHFIMTRYKINCVFYDIQDFPEDLRPMDLDYVLDLYETIDKKLKTPGLNFKVASIEAFYKKLVGGQP